MTLTCNTLPGGSQASILAALQQASDDLHMGPDYRSGRTGASKELARTGLYFLIAFSLTFIFMYIVLAAQFESFIHPITILLTLPLAIPFGILSLLIAHQTVNIFSGLGLLLLFGIVQNAHNYDVLGGKLVSERAIEAAWNSAVDASPIAAVKCFDAWTEDFRKDIPQIDVPALILHADEGDRVLPPDVSSRRTVKLIKDCKFVEFKDAPHNIPWTHAQQVNEELVSFLR